MNKLFFITTTLPYANSNAHVGHCLEFVQADALARYLRQRDNVYFNIGLDEHGLKIYQAAVQQNKTPLEFVDEISKKWFDFCDLLEISYDSFYRTSHFEHHVEVAKYWTKLVETGDLYKKDYTGRYCIGCEEFKTETQLVNDRCELHQTTELQTISEENWFFKLSKYRDKILRYVKSNSFLKPVSKQNELINLIQDAKDISVSRLRNQLPWGVEVPNDPDQTIYVWFDALLNYLFSIGPQTWNNDNVVKIQLCGPDNLKFQALVWQGILLADWNKFTDHLLVHGTVLDADGQKMSKSLGNVIDPIDQINRFGIDAVRYYILKGLDTYNNGNWNTKDLCDLYNNDLADNFGNLLARTLHLIETQNIAITPPTEAFELLIENRIESIQSSWSFFKISQAFEKTNELVSFGNKYIIDEKPWAKDIGVEKKIEVLSNLHYLLSTATDFLSPAIPTKAEEAKTALKELKKVILFVKIK